MEQSPLTTHHLFIFPIRIVGMLHVPERPAAVDGRDILEVVGRRRRRRGPFQSPGLPGIVPHRLPFHKDVTMLYAKIRKLGPWNRSTSWVLWVPMVQPPSSS